MLSSIPSEIVFEILGHLSPSIVLDAQTLQSASLSCSHLRSFCQKALFSRIVLSEGKGPSDRLLEAFHTSPILATYVQSLTIKQEGTWVRSDLKLPEVLEFLLDALAPITEFSCLLNIFVAWQDYPARTRKSINALCTLAFYRVPDKQCPFIDLRGQSLILLTELVNLQIITISLIEGSTELQYLSGLFLRLGAMLQSLPFPNYLRLLQLGDRDEPEVSLGRSQLCEAMQQLDSILSEPKFRSLQKLMLLVSAPSEEALIAQFPHLQQRGVLRLPGAQEESGDMIVASASDRVNHIYR
ncbi:hypothetical protein BKA70DRAFT_1430943 [Coprinopsis sp. MPI-PUGE-AT-0042]|nr:hypothetical protein BKA70DRAFT_1430943 [Coprinopsis sp. MPI-PUGE-AT-0042]